MDALRCTATSTPVLSFVKTVPFQRDPIHGAMSMIMLSAPRVGRSIAMVVLGVLRGSLLRAQGRVAANLLPCSQSNFLPLVINTIPCRERWTD